MGKLACVKQRMESLDRQQEKARGEEIEAIRRQFVRCMHCHKKSRLAKWYFVQEHWYEEPRGCTGGDNWHSSYPDVCTLICPKCEKENYIYNHPEREKLLRILGEKPWSRNKNPLFAKVGDRYKRHSIVGENPPKIHWR